MKLIDSDYNEVTGLTTRYFSGTNEYGKPVVHVQVLQDVEPQFDANKIEFNGYSSKSRVPIQEGLGTKVASIPMGLVAKLHKEGLNVLNCSADELKRLLNNPDYSKIRTAPGKV